MGCWLAAPALHSHLVQPDSFSASSTKWPACAHVVTDFFLQWPSAFCSLAYLSVPASEPRLSWFAYSTPHQQVVADPSSVLPVHFLRLFTMPDEGDLLRCPLFVHAFTRLFCVLVSIQCIFDLLWFCLSWLSRFLSRNESFPRDHHWIRSGIVCTRAPREPHQQPH